MEDYPRTLDEFNAGFGSEEACRAYLFHLRWPDGFVCPKCQTTTAWRTKRTLIVCGSCGYQSSVTAGTIFEGTHKPLRMWFQASWRLTSQKTGASALGLQQVLGLCSYYTAWTWLHKLRRAMVRPGRDRISGVVEVDESYIGGKKSGKRGRGAAGKALVVIVAQIEGDPHRSSYTASMGSGCLGKKLGRCHSGRRRAWEYGSYRRREGVHWLEPYRLHS